MEFNTAFIIPIRDDYESAKNLLTGFNDLLEINNNINGRFILIDDGSTQIDYQIINETNLEVEIVEAKYKMGHQKAIFLGLNFVSEKYENLNIIILDGDGEDKPEDAITIAKMLQSGDQTQVVLARRLTRKTSLFFKISYSIFRYLFKKLVGLDLRSGNFMGIKSEYLKVLKSFPSLKSHIAGSVIRYCPNIEYVDFNRGLRIAGKSQMNLPRLALHAYGAFAVFADILIARITFILVALSISLGISGVALFFFKIFGFTDALPGWTSIILVQIASTTILLSSFALLSLFLFLKDDE